MLTIRNRILEAIPKVQPVLEEILDFKVGEVIVEPSWKCYSEISKESLDNPDTKGIPRYLFHIIGFPLFMIKLPLEEISGTNAFVLRSKIYYSINPISNLLASKKEVEHITAHELTHIAHHKIIPYNCYEFCKISSNIKEGFAEHTSRAVMSRIYPDDEERTGVYDRHVKEFREELQKRGLDEEKDLVKAIKELSQI